MSALSPDAVAVLNIMGNAGEILGISAGAPMLVLSFIPYSCGLKGYSSKLAILGIVMVVVGLAYPGIENMLCDAIREGAVFNSILAGLAVAIGGIFLVVSWVAGLAMPTIIAVREKREKKVAIIACNFFAAIPGPWLIAYIWACMPDKPPTSGIEQPFSG